MTEFYDDQITTTARTLEILKMDVRQAERERIILLLRDEISDLSVEPKETIKLQEMILEYVIELISR